MKSAEMTESYKKALARYMSRVRFVERLDLERLARESGESFNNELRLALQTQARDMFEKEKTKGRGRK